MEEGSEVKSLSELKDEYKPQREKAGNLLQNSGLNPNSPEYRKARAKIAKEFTTKDRESLIDELTGLYNKRGFTKRLEEEVAYALRSGENLFVATIDANDLKRINDTEGHQEGDNLIKDVANFLKRTSRKEDVVARIGGDEYRVILKGTNMEGMRTWARRMTSNFTNTSISVAIGGALLDKNNPQISIEESDKFMYEAKNLSKQTGGSVYFDNEVKHL